MEDNLYRMIIRVAVGILLVTSAVVYLVSRDFLYVASVLWGGILSIAGFLGILFSTAHMELSGNVQKKIVGAYLFRYLIYFACMFAGAKVGLNILLMLVGFLCINLSIKGITLMERKEES